MVALFSLLYFLLAFGFIIWLVRFRFSQHSVYELMLWKWDESFSFPLLRIFFLNINIDSLYCFFSCEKYLKWPHHFTKKRSWAPIKIALPPPHLIELPVPSQEGELFWQCDTFVLFFTLLHRIPVIFLNANGLLIFIGYKA